MHREKDFNRLKACLSVNLLALDEELADMPAHVQEAGEIASEVSERRDGIKRKLEQRKAEVAQDIRNAVEKKPPEAAIAEEVALDRDVQNLGTDLDRMEREYSAWISLVNGLRTKSSSLKHIAEMMVAGFITPSSARDRVLDEKQAAREAKGGRR